MWYTVEVVDAETRVKIKRARDAAARRRLGMRGSERSVSRKRGTNGRRWTEAEIRVSVGRLAGEGTLTGIEYIQRRSTLDPNEFPSYDTVKRRCPDLLK